MLFQAKQHSFRHANIELAEAFLFLFLIFFPSAGGQAV